MPWISDAAQRLHSLLFRRREEREMDEELAFHVERATEEHVRRGMTPDEARRRALIELGGVERTKEEVRDARGVRPAEDLLRDAGHALRGFRRNPGFTASALLVLALGIGSATALFTVVDGVLLRPLPYPGSDRLVRVWPAAPARGVEHASFSYPNFRDWRERTSSLSDLAVYTTLPADYPYLGGDEPSELSTAWVAGDFFQLLSVPPAVGRTLTPEDAEVGRRVVVLSNGAWRRLFGGDPSVVGRTIDLDYRSFEVVGVMPPGFDFPREGDPVEIWVPLTVIPADDIPIRNRAVNFLDAVGRLAPGAGVETARQELGGIATSLASTYPDADAGTTSATVTPLKESMVGDVKTALWVMLGAVGFLLLLAGANVANLLLARGSTRSREVALRLSLGASAGRVVRQLLTESVLLVFAGGALGVAAAWLAVRAVPALAGDLLPRAADVHLDARVVGASLLLTLATAALATVLPTLRSMDVSPGEGLREGGRGSSGGDRRGLRLRRGLVTVEVAVSIVLLVGAGLLVRSLGALGRVDPGFRTDGRIAMTLTISDGKHPERSDWLGLYHGILDRLAALPGVTDAGAVRYLPYRGTGDAVPVQVPGLYEPAPDEQRYAETYQVSEGAFRALGMTLLRGRPIRSTDGSGDPVVSVVNEAFQRDYFHGQEPVGRRIEIPGSSVEIQVVGVVADVRQRGPGEDPRPAMYMSNDQIPRIQMSYVVHTTGDPLALAGSMRGVVRQLDPDQPVTEIVPLASLQQEALARPRFFTRLLGGFALVALVLAGLGIYAVLAYAVRTRRHEIGVRLALGATVGRIVRDVVGDGLGPVLVGLLAGGGVAVGLTRFLASLLFRTETLDPVAYGTAAFVVLVVAVAACIVPAWAAARVEPVETLGAE